MDQQALAKEDAGLRDAALTLVRQIHHIPERLADVDDAATGESLMPRALELSQIGLEAIERAEAAAANVDALLNGRPQ